MCLKTLGVRNILLILEVLGAIQEAHKEYTFMGHEDQDLEDQDEDDETHLWIYGYGYIKRLSALSKVSI